MRKVEVIENIFIFLAIFSIWPVIFRWPGRFYRYIMYLFLPILGIILFNRARRLRKLWKNFQEEVKKEGEKFRP